MAIKSFVVCRDEPYGGIIFNQHSGYTFKVDAELFSAFLAYHRTRTQGLSPQIQTALEFIGVGCEEMLHWEQIPPLPFKDFEIAFSPEKVSFAITDYCHKECAYCYSKATPQGTFFEVKNLPFLIDQLVANRVLQVTIGGGEPTAHPQLGTILKALRTAQIIPNITTNGLSLNSAHLEAIKRYCGAMAFSIDGNYSCTLLEGVKRARTRAIPCHLHCIVSKGTLPRLEQILRPYFPIGIQSLTLLLFKPIGRGADMKAQTLSEADLPRLREQIQWLRGMAQHYQFQIVFDSCFLPYLIRTGVKFSPIYADYCTAARSSCAIDQALRVKPCSLLSGPHLSLREFSLQQIWWSVPFQEFRTNFTRQRPKCGDCTHWTQCRGGCVLYYELAPC